MQTPTTTDAGWPTEWLRGALAVCVLHVIAGGPTYGYAIANALADAGLGTVKGGTLYPLLGRLEEAGLVSVEWRAGEGGPGRKFYALTPAGEEEHRRQVTHWLAFVDVTSSFVHGSALAQPSRKEPS
ncbi:PadR family transcriptional regulator [Nocardioides cavernae]|uniref:PadR family transcriptional regulator n=1 Tax=Nocardioides cavernae TaxID=1921566 RepID=A0ABR8N8Y6_9ACTN|nr:PadR family transcriptional regulator [Nocardioides cavernae]MBD3924598.1 PadR family transcriptional regulator [Nocardioides cavernae]MBM7515029.1 PadR family transcriptional regulator PadR [Nocardioides cavernae]